MQVKNGLAVCSGVISILVRPALSCASVCVDSQCRRMLEEGITRKNNEASHFFGWGILFAEPLSRSRILKDDLHDGCW